MRFLIVIVLCCVSFLGSAQNLTDSKGRKQGPWSKTYPGTKVIQYKGEFKDDVPVGTFTYYYENAKVKAIIKHGEGAKRSEAFFYHDNSKLMSYGIYRNQKKDSIWLNFGPSGRLSSSETYVNDVLHGKMTIYYIPEDPNDKSQKVAEVRNYVDGKLDGEYVEYFNTGVVKKKGKYSMGKKIGVWEQYNLGGKRNIQERFKDGMLHGWCYAYDDTGKLVGKQYYYNNKRLQGKELDAKLEYFKKNGIDPNE